MNASRIGALSDKPKIMKMLELWGSGVSAQKIAEQMNDGITRNAVIGKIGRLRMKFGARRLTLDMIADVAADNGKLGQFDQGSDPLGYYGLAMIRRGLGAQAI